MYLKKLAWVILQRQRLCRRGLFGVCHRVLALLVVDSVVLVRRCCCRVLGRLSVPLPHGRHDLQPTGLRVGLVQIARIRNGDFNRDGQRDGLAGCRRGVEKRQVERGGGDWGRNSGRSVRLRDELWCFAWLVPRGG